MENAEEKDLEEIKQEHEKGKMARLGCIVSGATMFFTPAGLPVLEVYTNPGVTTESKFVVAHAGGAMPNDSGKLQKYLNCVEGVEYYYNKGSRFFEIDFAFSKDNELVGTHKYEYLEGYSKKNRILFEDYKKLKIAGKYTGMTIERLFDLIRKYPDAKFIIDSKEDNHYLVYDKIVEYANNVGLDISTNILPFVSSKTMLNQLDERYDFKEYMFTNYKEFYTTKDLLDIIESNKKIKYIHLFPMDLARIDIEKINQVRIRVFAHMDRSTTKNTALKYGCTGIFSDNITEDFFNETYKQYLFDKLTNKQQNLEQLVENKDKVNKSVSLSKYHFSSIEFNNEKKCFVFCDSEKNAEVCPSTPRKFLSCVKQLNDEMIVGLMDDLFDIVEKYNYLSEKFNYDKNIEKTYLQKSIDYIKFRNDILRPKFSSSVTEY